MVRGTRAVVAGLVGAVAVVLAAAPAAAHTELKASTPADGATLPAAPKELRLTFTGTLGTKEAQVTVTDAAGGTHPVTATVRGRELVAPVTGLGGGAYTVAYRVRSIDGHPVSGTLRFTVTGPPSTTAPPTTAPPTTGAPPTMATPAGGASPAVSPAGDASEPGGGGPVGLLVALAAVLAAGGAGAFLVRRRRSA